MTAGLKFRAQRVLARLAKSVPREALRDHPDVHDYLEFGGPEEIALPAADSVETTNPAWLRSNLALWQPSWPAPFVCLCDNTRLLGSLYLGVTQQGEMILETTRTAGSPELLWPKITRHTLRNMLSLTNRALERLPADVVAPLFHVSQDSYFHWFCDVLPIVEAARRLEGARGVRVTFLAGKPLRAWQLETLALLGVDPAAIIYWSGTAARVSTLMVASVRTDGWTCLPSIASLRWIRTEMMRTALPAKETPPDIYVRRTGRRQFTNEDEVTALMASRGIAAVDTDGMPVVDQIRLFNQARLIVSPHGAGLTNLIFSEQAQVVELFGPWKSLCFATIARGFGHGYAGVDLLPSAGFQDSGAAGRSADVRADPALIQPALDRALDHARR